MKNKNHCSKSLIPNYQFGFSNKHSTIDQIRRVTDIVEDALEEEREINLALFLDVGQTRHEGHIYM